MATEEENSTEIPYIEQSHDKSVEFNTDTSKACWLLRSDLKKCIMESDCILKHGKSARECMNSEDLPESCKNTKYAYYLCRRSMLDMRARFRGRKGDLGKYQYYTHINMEEFTVIQKELLKEEHQAEVEECSALQKSLPLSELQNRGVCIKKLHIMSMKTGLYGRTVIKLSLRGAPDRSLPSNNFSSGDIVDIHLKTATNFTKPELQGVVTSTKDSMICIALDGDGSRSKADELHSNDMSLILFKSANEVTYRRLQKGLDRLLHHKGVSSNLLNICFGDTKPTSYSAPVHVTNFYNKCLNSSQQEAINFALSQRDIAVIHGPPGTGKTTTIAELISQLVSDDQKVLACAPSNVAIDNILEKLSGVTIERRHGDKGGRSGIRMIRLGHPARILIPELHKLSLDAMVAKSDAAKIVQDVRKDIDNLHVRFRKRHNKSEQVKLREEKKILMQELRDREKKAITEILTTADVILATNVGAHSDGPLRHLPKDHFQVAVIDECGQALEASCWIPILLAPKVILAGDHLQLPPTVKSHSAAAKGLSKSLLERITECHGEVVKMLNTQYRMNLHIMNWSSKELYDSKLEAHSSVRDHTLAQLTGVDETEDTVLPLLLIDTAGCDMPELQTIDSESIGNPREAEIVAHHVESLIQAGVSESDIAVVSPYNMQVDILRTMLHQKFRKLEIRSIDGFQGREKEAVVISLVRSNDKGVVGFLSDDRRMNVAVTRARRHLALTCDSETVGRHKFLRTLLDYMAENGEVRSGHEFSQYSSTEFGTSKYTELECKRKPVKPHNLTKPQEQHDLTGVKLKFRKTIEQFIKRAQQGGPKFHEFPKSLLGHERLAVHELCEELGIHHNSTGEGKERKVIVSIDEESPTIEVCLELNSAETQLQQDSQQQCKEDATSGVESAEIRTNRQKVKQKGPKITAKKKDTQTTSELLIKDKQYSTNKTEKPKEEKPRHEASSISISAETSNQECSEEMCTCQICGCTLPIRNIKLHTTHCERLQAMKEKLTPKQLVNDIPKQKKRPQKGKKKKKTISCTRDGEKNDDQLLEDAIQANKSCSVEGCEKFVSVLRQTCSFCKRHYCLEHNLPELHGCGNAAHSAARQQICRDGILYSGSGIPSKKLPPAKHANLQRKLDTKLKEMENKRKPSHKKK